MSVEFYLLLACLVLLVILLIRQASLTHRQEKDQMRQEHSLTVLGNQLLDNLDAQHDGMVESLQNTNQHLLSTMSQMGQNQTTLLESMQRQVLLSTRNQEENQAHSDHEFSEGAVALNDRQRCFEKHYVYHN